MLCYAVYQTLTLNKGELMHGQNAQWYIINNKLYNLSQYQCISMDCMPNGKYYLSMVRSRTDHTYEERIAMKSQDEMTEVYTSIYKFLIPNGQVVKQDYVDTGKVYKEELT
tara:strand:+ start:22029 stop:22361 length:333 start_codon:yes stop_codon:yes gene_type:complete